MHALFDEGNSLVEVVAMFDAMALTFTHTYCRNSFVAGTVKNCRAKASDCDKCGGETQHPQGVIHWSLQERMSQVVANRVLIFLAIVLLINFLPRSTQFIAASNSDPASAFRR